MNRGDVVTVDFSQYNCSNLYTIRQSDVTRVIGRLTRTTMDNVDACLKVALAIR
jgi:mRNA-degrading endonuclease toxin of MazEF toxin-antitoxin module